MVPESLIVELEYLQVRSYSVLLFHLEPLLLFFVLVANSCIPSMLIPLHHTKPTEMVTAATLHMITPLVFLDWFMTGWAAFSVA